MEGTGQTPPGWWAQRFMRYALAELLPGDAPTPQRVKRARGAEADLRLGRGAIEARVTAGASAYTASLRVKPLGQREWKRVLDAVAADPDAAQRLLAGQPGPELEAACAGVGVDLFPPPKAALLLRCTCRQWNCRHIVVLLVKVANLLAATPLLWLEVLGQPRAELLAAVRGRLADRGAGARRGAATDNLDPDRFWRTSMDPDSIRVRPGDAAAPDALLRRLGPLPLPLPLGTVELRAERQVSRGERSFTTWGVVRQPVDTVLRQYAAAVARAAAELAHGERPPAFDKEPLPGKAIPLGPRVAAEVAEAALSAARPLDLAELAEATPTASALGPDVAYHVIRDALRSLPPEVTVLGEQVGPRAAFLAGARFRQVISFAEWRARRLDPASDWLFALRRVGFPGPYTVQVGQSRLCIPEEEGAGPDPLFAQLQPSVGDELELQVIDPAEPLLVATLHRRAERSLVGRAEASTRATTILRSHLDLSSVGRLPLIEAVGLLLGAGVYRQPALPDPVWLLPAAVTGLYHAPRSRDLVRESWYGWLPEFGRRYGAWAEQPRTLSGFAASLAQAGWSVQELDPALRFIQRWCQYWTPPQDRPGEHPPVRELLHFLWHVAPREAARAVAPRVPELLAAWFRFLGEQHPAMAEIYREHIAACEVPGAYEHRLQTCPRQRAEEAAWELEGYGWLGPDAYFG